MRAVAMWWDYRGTAAASGSFSSVSTWTELHPHQPFHIYSPYDDQTI